MREGLFLRVYVNESDCVEHQPVLDFLFQIAQQQQLRGMTVFRAIEGLGACGLHSSSLLALSQSLPLVFEVVDDAAAVHGFIQRVQPLLGHHTLVTWPVSVIEQKGVVLDD